MSTFITLKCKLIKNFTKQSIHYIIFSAAAVLMKKMLNILYHFEPIYRWTKLYILEQKHIHNGALKISDEIFNQKKVLQLEFEANDENANEELCKKKSKNFIETLMDPSNGLDEAEIKDEINTLVAAVSKILFLNFDLCINFFLLRVTKRRHLSFQTHS